MDNVKGRPGKGELTPYRESREERTKDSMSWADVHFKAMLDLFQNRSTDINKFFSSVTALEIIIQGFADEQFEDEMLILEEKKRQWMQEQDANSANLMYFDEKAKILSKLVKRANAAKIRLKEYIDQSRFVNEIARKLIRGTGQNLFITGKPGSGKSWSAISIALAVCEITGVPFNINNICFTPEQFMARYNDKEVCPEGGFLIFDEAGVTFNSRDAQTSANKLFGKLMQVMRFRSILVIFTAPDLSFIDKTGRKLLHWWLETDRLDMETNICYIHPHTVELDQRTGEFLFPFPVFDNMQLSELRIKKAPAEVAAQYKAKEKEYKDSVAEKTEEGIRSNSLGIEERRTETRSKNFELYSDYREQGLSHKEIKDKLNLSAKLLSDYNLEYNVLKSEKISNY